jgi:hypothetical protein
MQLSFRDHFVVYFFLSCIVHPIAECAFPLFPLLCSLFSEEGEPRRRRMANAYLKEAQWLIDPIVHIAIRVC